MGQYIQNAGKPIGYFVGMVLQIALGAAYPNHPVGKLLLAIFVFNLVLLILSAIFRGLAGCYVSYGLSLRSHTCGEFGYFQYQIFGLTEHE